MQLRAQGYTRTSSAPRKTGIREAGFATTPQDAPKPPARRGGLGRSLLVASVLGAAAGAALLTWEQYDPVGAAPVKKIADDSLDMTLATFRQARDVAQPYVDQLLGVINPKTEGVRPSASAPAANRVEPKPALAADAQAEAASAAAKEDEEDQKRAKVILLEGVKNVEEEDDEDDDVDAVVTSDDDGATRPLSKLTSDAPKAEPVPAHDPHAELDRKRAAEEAELRQRLEEEERRAEEEAARKREQKRRLAEAEEQREREAEAAAAAAERLRQEAEARHRHEEAQRRKAEEAEAHKAEATKGEAHKAEAEAHKAESAAAPKAKPDAEARKTSLKEQVQKRREQTDKLRLAALEAKQRREDAELAKRREAIPPRLLSPAAPAATPANPATEHAAPKPVLPAPTPIAPVVQESTASVAAAANGARKTQEEDASNIQAVLSATAERARKEEQEKFAKVMEEKERLVMRVHQSEAEAHAATWRRSVSQTFESIAHEMASRKYMGTADFAHLSAIFTGYIALKNALDKEQPFANELHSLKRAIHDDLAHHVIDSIPKSAASGVPTLQRIMTTFEQNVVPSVRQVAFTAHDDVDYPMPVQHLRRTFAWYVLGSLRVKSPEEFAAPAHTTYAEAERALAYTHEALNKGDLMAALQHIRRLPAGPVASVGQSWAQGLHDRLVVEQATTIFDALIPPAK